jgi:antitoxin HicB
VSKTRKFTVLLAPEPEGGFTVRVPALPEIVTYGETEASAMEMAQDAIELAVEHRLANGESTEEFGPISVHTVTVGIPAMY